MYEQVIFDSVDDYNKFNNHETLHPLVSVVNFSKANPRRKSRMHYAVYAILLKDVKCGDIKYGKHYYDYQEGTLVFLSPGQTIEIENDGEPYQPKGYALVFHPDFIRGTALGKKIHDYSFFSYDLHEALHVSERERNFIIDCLNKIEYELLQNLDKHSKGLILNNIEMLLNYCMRFYDRQFIIRENIHKGIVEKFDDLLYEYFHLGKSAAHGLPSVMYCAQQLNLSPNYFGDLIKKETGTSAQEYIHVKVMNIAKEKIFDINKSVSEVAYELGFKYPQHFTRFFKQRIGYTPNEYRTLN